MKTNWGKLLQGMGMGMGMGGWCHACRPCVPMKGSRVLVAWVVVGVYHARMGVVVRAHTET